MMSWHRPRQFLFSWVTWALLAARYGFSSVWMEEKMNPQDSKAFLAVAAYSSCFRSAYGTNNTWSNTNAAIGLPPTKHLIDSTPPKELLYVVGSILKVASWVKGGVWEKQQVSFHSHALQCHGSSFFDKVNLVTWPVHLGPRSFFVFGKLCTYGYLEKKWLLRMDHPWATLVFVPTGYFVNLYNIYQTAFPRR